MKFSSACQFGSALIFTFSTLISAAPNPHAVEPRQATSTRVADSACTNGPFSRACWQAGYSVATDFDNKIPPNGRERVYNLEITNTTMSPDGFEKIMFAINNQVNRCNPAFDV